MKKTVLLYAFIIFLFSLTSCSDDDNQPSNCFADNITLTQTKVNDLSGSSDAVIITFDAKNTSSSKYDISSGSAAIYITVTVTTTDNSTYETTQPLTVTSLSPGATASTDVLANYGSGKTYKSYKIDKKYCQ